MYLCTRKLRKHREPAMLTLTVLTPLIPLVIEGRKHASQSLHSQILRKLSMQAMSLHRAPAKAESRDNSFV